MCRIITACMARKYVCTFFETYFKKFAWQFKTETSAAVFITVILDVLNNFIRKRVTAKSSECSSALVSGQTSTPYKRTGGMHCVVTRCRTTSSDATLPTLPNIALADR